MSKILTPQQIKAARMLAEGRSGREIARALDVCPNTLSVWKRIPEFMNEIKTVMDEDREASRDMYARLAEKSVAALWSELHDASMGSKRVQAALGILRLLGIERISQPNILENNEMYAKPPQSVPSVVPDAVLS